MRLEKESDSITLHISDGELLAHLFDKAENVCPSGSRLLVAGSIGIAGRTDEPNGSSHRLNVTLNVLTA